MGCEEVVAPRRAGVGSDHFVVTSYTSRCRPWLALFDFWTTTAAARSCRAPPPDLSAMNAWSTTSGREVFTYPRDDLAATPQSGVPWSTRPSACRFLRSE